MNKPEFIRLQILFIFALLNINISFAQTSIESNSISSTGGEAYDALGNNYMYDIGGLVVSSTPSGNSIILTQGFEQPNSKVSDVFIFNPPNAFSPDGDGVNDTWIIPLIGFSDATMNVVIFNRWGDEVNRIDDYNNLNNVWDGTYQKSGEPVTNGTYFYVVETEDATKRFSGWIQVVR